MELFALVGRKLLITMLVPGTNIIYTRNSCSKVEYFC